MFEPGQKNKYVTGSGNSTLVITTTTINALNIPFLLEAGRTITFQAGPQFGFLLSGNEKGTIDNPKLDEDLKDVMKTLDVSFVVGLGINATNNLNLEFGLTWEFHPCLRRLKMRLPTIRSF